MASDKAEFIICGAGMAGISTAYHLTVTYGRHEVILIDERPPLSLTSAKSTECYRNWWPGPDNAMVSLTNRSIDLLEELARQSGNIFNLNRRGYLFATARQSKIEEFQAFGLQAEAFGSGPLRLHTGKSSEPPYVPAPEKGFEDQPQGADLITDRELIREHFPYLSSDTVAVIHARRCGWLSAQQLGTYMLEQAKAAGARLITGRVVGAQVENHQIKAVHILAGEGSRSISTDNFVIAAGPFLKEVAGLIGVDLPVFSELHAKIVIHDHLAAMPRDAPLIIWTDPQRLPWSEEEKEMLAQEEETRWLLKEFPPRVHARPEGPADSSMVIILWTYDEKPVDPVIPPTLDEVYYPEIVLRGISTGIPGFKAYWHHLPKPIVDGGYYTKTGENRPLIGPLPIQGAYLIGALSGFGIMASPAAGELLAARLVGDELPDYASSFRLDRYQDPRYRRLLKDWGPSGQI